MTNRITRKIVYWQNVLNLVDYRIVMEKVSPLQVTFEDGRIGGCYVGSHLDEQNKTITLSSTRPLREDDVVHELVHMRYPQFSEAQVVEETASLILSRDYIFMEGVPLSVLGERAA